MDLKSGINYIPHLIFDLWLLILVLFFNAEAKTILIIFFVELIIFSIFRFGRRINQVEKDANVGSPHSLTNTIISFIVLVGASIIIMVMLDNAHTASSTLSTLDILYNNWFLIVYMFVVEIIFMIDYFSKKDKKDISFYHGYLKLFLTLLFLFFIGFIMNVFPSESAIGSGLKILAVSALLAKIIIDYSMAKR